MSEMKIEPSKYAFPRAPGAPDTGMSLRDWFAGQALAGFAAGLSSAPEGQAPRAMDRVVFSDLVKDAFTVADAMLAERSK